MRVILVVCVAVLMSSCVAYPVLSIDGSRRGIVLDSETDEPISGVLVAGVMSEDCKVFMADRRTYNVHEKYALSDKNGVYHIPWMFGWSIRLRWLLMNSYPRWGFYHDEWAYADGYKYDTSTWIQLDDGCYLDIIYMKKGEVVTLRGDEYLKHRRFEAYKEIQQEMILKGE